MDKNLKENPAKESIAVVGGGITGIAAAINLAKSGRLNVTILEKEDHIGGLSDFFRWNGIIWDRFYHVILSTDTILLDFIKELNLKNDIFWRDTKSGFYGEGKLVSLSSTLDFIKFPFMSYWQKFRLALGILYSARIKEPSRLDKINAQQWLTRIFGKQVYQNIWDPLLRSKLGNARDKTSAAFIWATINRLYGARESGNKKEKMGHVGGGYRTILRAAENRLSELGVRLITDSPVHKLELRMEDQSISNNKKDHPGLTFKNNRILMTTDKSKLTFDKVLLTIDCPDILKLLGDTDTHPYWSRLNQVNYLGVACVSLILSRKLSPYYVINLLDKELSFTGIIEVTNIVAPQDLGANHLVYLPKYMPADDPVNRLSDQEIIALFVTDLKRVFPDLKDHEIIHRKIFRETYVQPLQKINSLSRSTGFRTPLQGVYLVNKSMIYNSTLNNNAVIGLAQKAAETIFSDMAVIT